MKKRSDPDPSRAVLDEIARRILRFQKLIAASRRSPSPANIHDLRVSIRRLAAAVAACRDIADDRRFRTARSSIKKLMAPLGRLRDLHVQKELISLSGCARTPMISGFLGTLAEEIARETGSASAAVRAFDMGPVDAFARTVEKGCAAGGLGAKLSHAALYRMLRRRAAKAERSRKRCLRTGKMKDFHALRIAYKHLRYFAELMMAADPRVTRREVERVHAMQRRMGAVHDMHVLGERLEPYSVGAAQRIKRKEMNLRAACDRALARFAVFETCILRAKRSGVEKY